MTAPGAEPNPAGDGWRRFDDQRGTHEIFAAETTVILSGWRKACLTGPDTDLTDRDSPSRMPPPPDHIHRRRQRDADPTMPVLEVGPSEPDVRICQRNVLIDQAHGPGAAMMGIPCRRMPGRPAREPDGAHHEGRLGCRRPRPTAMTSRRDVDTEPRTGNASSGFSEDLRRVLETELLKGPCTSIEIARRFSMHHRTLSRHLAREGARSSSLSTRSGLRSPVTCWPTPTWPWTRSRSC